MQAAGLHLGGVGRGQDPEMVVDRLPHDRRRWPSGKQKQRGGDEHKAQARIVSGFVKHDAGHLAHFLHAMLHVAFNIASPLIWLCWGDGEEPPGPELVRSYFGLRRATWDTVEFQLPYGEWIRLFRSTGFDVLDLVELRPPARPRTTYPDFAPVRWARRWPGENIWKLRKLG